MSKHDALVSLHQIAEHGSYARDLCAGKTLAELLDDWKSVLALSARWKYWAEWTR